MWIPCMRKGTESSEVPLDLFLNEPRSDLEMLAAKFGLISDLGDCGPAITEATRYDARTVGGVI